MKSFLALSALATLAVAPRNTCNNLSVDTGAGSTRVCGRTSIGDICTYSCVNGEERTVECTGRNQWSTIVDCPAPPPPAPDPDPPAPADCLDLAFDTGAGSQTVCTTSASGSSCSFDCLSGEPRTTTCSDGSWSALASCPAACGDFTFNIGSTSATVCPASNSGASCTFSCESGDSLTATCAEGAWTSSGTCPTAVQCGSNNPLYLESQALNTVAGSAGVAQDRRDSGRFRVEWNADTIAVPATAGTLAASRLPREVGQFELMAECCIDQAASLAELPIQFMSGSATFQYDRDTITWDFGPLFNPTYLSPPDNEPGIVIVPNAAETAILQLIWVEKFEPAEGPPGPVRVRVQGEAEEAFPRGWPADTQISVSATFNIKVAGSDTIYTYTTESGAFDYGDVNGQTNLVAGVALGVTGLVGATWLAHKRLQYQTTMQLQEQEAFAAEGDMEELPDLEETGVVLEDAGVVVFHTAA